MQAGASTERRERHAQRDAVERVLPDRGEASLLRLADGRIHVFEGEPEKWRPVELRAIVMPDGETLEFETNRFHRGR